MTTMPRAGGQMKEKMVAMPRAGGQIKEKMSTMAAMP